mmetsp:Transcript_90511/g.156831  ORF Transcript_90511/g.156831 Transcript_90511/m.156831 type:complete len:310 (-) Transcript_90511:22-951(-)
MWRIGGSRGICTFGLRFSSLAAPASEGSSSVLPSDPFEVLKVSGDATRDDLRNQFFELAKSQHPALTGDQVAFDRIKEAYESAIKIVDAKSPIPLWDGVSAMTYAQAWEGKDHWRKIWEEHWANRLAHMYKHNEEITVLDANLKWREAQYHQIKDWMVLAKDVMDPKMKGEWKKSCELAQATLLWARTNKSNYKRYYISNTNVPVNMHQVYQEHEYWRQYENVNWGEWDAFFAQASAWAATHEGAIRAANNTDGPLGNKFEYLFSGKMKYASMSPEEKLALKESEESMYNKLFWKAEVCSQVLSYLGPS